MTLPSNSIDLKCPLVYIIWPGWYSFDIRWGQRKPHQINRPKGALSDLDENWLIPKVKCPLTWWFGWPTWVSTFVCFSTSLVGNLINAKFWSLCQVKAKNMPDINFSETIFKIITLSCIKFSVIFCHLTSSRECVHDVAAGHGNLLVAPRGRVEDVS